MEIIQIVGLALAATVISVIIKEYYPEIAVQISIITGIIIFAVISVKIGNVINLLKELADKVNIDMLYISTIIKIVGIAYITQFASEVCRDAGEGAIAAKVELAGKILIVVMAAPIILGLLKLLVELLP